MKSYMEGYFYVMRGKISSYRQASDVFRETLQLASYQPRAITRIYLGCVFSGAAECFYSYFINTSQVASCASEDEVL